MSRHMAGHLCRLAVFGVLGIFLQILPILESPLAWAGKADVVAVEATEGTDGVCTFTVMVRHGDQDPAHWADWWRVRTPEGKELGRRVLLHSHVGEQPFTRDERIRIPPGVSAVLVEAHDKVHGLGGKAVTVNLTRPSGPGFTVKRRR